MNRSQFVDAVLVNPVNRAILERLPALNAPDSWLVSGALFQTVWNGLTGRPAQHGIKDYDVLYFDPDTSWEAEDVIIKRAAALFADLGAAVEVRNQARVHIWYEEKFGAPYPPLARATEGVDRFLAECCMVGMRPKDGAYEVYAPKGFADIASLTLRPNRMPNYHPERYAEKARRWRENWPELTILAP
ncbi:MAG TPA: nucleotidyltransferase family protein [Rhizomicrobium sp.]|jgi:hypothetical protein|nr:nucleotidyltransferase family protein [Rhizomicrobium sp.]